MLAALVLIVAIVLVLLLLRQEHKERQRTSQRIDEMTRQYREAVGEDPDTDPLA